LEIQQNRRYLHVPRQIVARPSEETEMSELEQRALRMVGQRFGRLVVISVSDRTDKARRLYWSCQCDCGNLHIVGGRYLRSGKSKSCGCIARPHGMSYTKEFACWKHILERCYNSNCAGYADYGGRGIGICERWRASFIAFFEDMGNIPNGKSIERIDNAGDYSKDNCRWASPLEQQQNTRQTKPCRVFGTAYTSIGSASRSMGISRSTLRWRIDNHFDGYEVMR